MQQAGESVPRCMRRQVSFDPRALERRVVELPTVVVDGDRPTVAMDQPRSGRRHPMLDVRLPRQRDRACLRHERKRAVRYCRGRRAALWPLRPSPRRLSPSTKVGSPVRHLTALLMKWAYIEAVALVLLMPATGATFGQVTMVAIATTLLLYAAGHLLVLPALGNLPAVAGDFGLALVIVWAAPFYSGVQPGFGSALL